ncbi:hypothetical protein B0T10DRAFT_165078 [Thelonectria olida]|uniref:Uncharacterized protein n=1 Tax=Thelonectria olida TaxID=1576542 RepID=A0A9P8WG03_9HYPO|nr:hypothetical protein B0T10DRAFT_165078 [Thelonectria olida]
MSSIPLRRRQLWTFLSSAHVLGQASRFLKCLVPDSPRLPMDGSEDAGTWQLPPSALCSHILTTPLDAETSSFCLKTVVKVGGLSETLISLAYVLAYHCVTILPVLLHLSLCILCFFWGFSLACYAYPTSACLSFLPCDASVGSWAQGALDLTT